METVTVTYDPRRYRLVRVEDIAKLYELMPPPPVTVEGGQRWAFFHSNANTVLAQLVRVLGRMRDYPPHLGYGRKSPTVLEVFE